MGNRETEGKDQMCISQISSFGSSFSTIPASQERRVPCAGEGASGTFHLPFANHLWPELAFPDEVPTGGCTLGSSTWFAAPVPLQDATRPGSPGPPGGRAFPCLAHSTESPVAAPSSRKLSVPQLPDRLHLPSSLQPLCSFSGISFSLL